MATINIPEVHSLQSALKRYRSYQKIRYWAPKAIILGVILLPIVYMILNSKPKMIHSTKSEGNLITIPFVLILGGVSGLVHVSNNRTDLRKSIVRVWLKGDSEKFLAIEKDIDKFLSTLPVESKESISSRKAKTRQMKWQMFRPFLVFIVILMLIAGLTEWLGDK